MFVTAQSTLYMYFYSVLWGKHKNAKIWVKEVQWYGDCALHPEA